MNALSCSHFVVDDSSLDYGAGLLEVTKIIKTHKILQNLVKCSRSEDFVYDKNV